MKRYAVKSIFRTIQGEGFHSGRSAIFVRFAGCNLWSGDEATRTRDASRQGVQCPLWCDTNFVGGERWTAVKICGEVAKLATASREHTFVVLTGGEPLLQVDHELLSALHDFVGQAAIETNGTIALDPSVAVWKPWITMSPKMRRANTRLERCDEIKLVVPSQLPSDWHDFPATHRWLSPCDPAAMLSATKSVELFNIRRMTNASVVELVQAHPGWRVSIQAHKVLEIP